MRLWLYFLTGAALVLTAPLTAEARGGGGGAHGGASQPVAGNPGVNHTGLKPAGAPNSQAQSQTPQGPYAGNRYGFYRSVPYRSVPYRSVPYPNGAYSYGYGRGGDRQGFGSNGYGYGGIGYGVPGVYANDYPSAQGAMPSQNFVPSPYAYGYEERPPQLTCFRPRLIHIGRAEPLKTHLPKVVYGGPLSCDYEGT